MLAKVTLADAGDVVQERAFFRIPLHGKWLLLVLCDSLKIARGHSGVTACGNTRHRRVKRSPSRSSVDPRQRVLVCRCIRLVGPALVLQFGESQSANIVSLHGFLILPRAETSSSSWSRPVGGTHCHHFLVKRRIRCRPIL